MTKDVMAIFCLIEKMVILGLIKKEKEINPQVFDRL